MAEADFNLLYIRSKKGEACEGSRTDCKAFACCCRGVSESIEDIGTLADLRIELAHLGISAGIVCNRAISIGCEGYSEG